jgi:hypothetical protein
MLGGTAAPGLAGRVDARTSSAASEGALHSSAWRLQGATKKGGDLFDQRGVCATDFFGMAAFDCR